MIQNFLKNEFVALVMKVIFADVFTKLVMVVFNIFVIVYMSETDFQNYVFVLH